MIIKIINKYCTLPILLFLTVLHSGLYGDGNVGASGADFLEIGVGSRPLGMGEAFTAYIGDINSIYYNPAGLATLKYPILSAHHQELIQDSRFENVSFAMPYYFGFLGVSNSTFWVPSFAKIDLEGNEAGKVQFYNTNTTATYAQSLDFMEAGASVKYIFQRVHTLKIHSAAMDFGILKKLYMYTPFDAPIRNFSLGLSIQNVGTKSKDDPLPRIVRFGLSYYLTKWLNMNVDLTENLIESSDLLDFTSGFNESFRIYSGIEAGYLDLLHLRAGYRFNESGTYSFGTGFNFTIDNVAFVVDTSYSDAGIFGSVYSFNITFKLIPKIITKEDERKAEEHYQKGIKFYVSDDIDTAINEFKTAGDFNPYHKNVGQKIEDLEELKKLKKEHEELNKELP